MVKIGNSWDNLIGPEFDKPYYHELRCFLKQEYKKYRIFPDMYDIFSALKVTPYEKVKAVIIGQDPYYGEGQAHGMCFSVKPGVAIPPSLCNIYKEIHDETGCEIPKTGYLLPWAKQGVLLLNTILTVRENEPNSHKGKGWEIFTDKIIECLNKREDPVVFLLWGANAKAKQELITESRHLVLCGAHPSPLSAYKGFFGCNHFNLTNNFLVSQVKSPIDWSVSISE